MKDYQFSPAANTTRKGGESQPKPGGSDSKTGSEKGCVPAVVGKPSPVVVSTGATNNG